MHPGGEAVPELLPKHEIRKSKVHVPRPAPPVLPSGEGAERAAAADHGAAGGGGGGGELGGREAPAAAGAAAASGEGGGRGARAVGAVWQLLKRRLGGVCGLETRAGARGVRWGARGLGLDGRPTKLDAKLRAAVWIRVSCFVPAFHLPGVFFFSRNQQPPKAVKPTPHTTRRMPKTTERVARGEATHKTAQARRRPPVGWRTLDPVHHPFNEMLNSLSSVVNVGPHCVCDDLHPARNLLSPGRGEGDRERRGAAGLRLMLLRLRRRGRTGDGGGGGAGGGEGGGLRCRGAGWGGDCRRAGAPCQQQRGGGAPARDPLLR